MPSLSAASRTGPAHRARAKLPWAACGIATLALATLLSSADGGAPLRGASLGAVPFAAARFGAVPFGVAPFQAAPSTAQVDTDLPAPATLFATGGELHALVVHGSLAFAGIGPRLVTLDLAEPGAPRWLGSSPVLKGRVTGLQVAGGFAYAVLEGWGLSVISVSDLSAPHPVGSLAIPGAAGIAGGPGWVYLSGRGLTAVDVSRPEAPEVTFILEADQAVGAVLFRGESLYLGLEDGRLTRYNLRDRARPAWLAERALDAPLTALALAGEQLVAGLGAGGAGQPPRAVVMDVADADTLRPLGELSLEQAPVALEADRGRAWVLDGAGGLQVLAIDAPAGPRRLGGRPLGEGGRALALTRDRAYTGLGGRLVALDAAAALTPTLLADARVGWSAERVVADGRRVLVAGVAAGLVIAPADPASENGRAEPIAPAWPGPGVGQAPALRDAAAFGEGFVLADEARGLVVLGAPPASGGAPPEVGRLAAPGAQRVLVGGAQALLLVGADALWSVDLAEPSTPRSRAVFRLPDDPGAPAEDAITDLVADGTTVLLATAGAELIVLDAADPDAPRIVARLPEAGTRLALAGTRLLASGSDRGLLLFDIANPAAPTRTARFREPGWSLGPVAADGDRAYLTAVADPRPPSPGAPAAAGAVELWALDLAAPGGPERTGVLELPGPVSDVAARDGRVWLAAGRGGLWSVRAVPPPGQQVQSLFLPLLAHGVPRPKPPEAVEQWRWINPLRRGETRELRIADWDGDGAAEGFLFDGQQAFALAGVGAGESRVAWQARAAGLAWGVDDLDGAGRPMLWTLDESGRLSRHRPDRPGPVGAQDLDLGPGMRLRAARVVDLDGSGARALVTLSVPEPDPAAPEPTRRWSLRAWRLPDLAPGWRLGIPGVPAELDGAILIDAQVDADPARELVLSFQGLRQAGIAFDLGWVIDPLASAVQWRFAPGFGEHLAAGDLDGDGQDELVASPPWPSGASLTVFDADLGMEAWRLDAKPMALALADRIPGGAPELVLADAWGRLRIVDAVSRAVLESHPPAAGGAAVLALAAGELDGAAGTDLLWLERGAGEAGAGDPPLPDALRWLAAGSPAPATAMRRHAGPYLPLAPAPPGAEAATIQALAGRGAAAGDLVPAVLLDAATGRERQAPGLAIDPVAQPIAEPRPWLADLDADPEPELLLGLGGLLYALDDDGSRIAVADLDAIGLADPAPIGVMEPEGDGRPRVIVHGRRRLGLVTLPDLAVDWLGPSYPSDLREAVAADFDADGGLEVAVLGREIGVELWDLAARGLAWRVPDSAWSVDALVGATITEGAPPALGLIEDGQLSWIDVRSQATLGRVDLWRGWEPLAFLPLWGRPLPQMLAGGGDRLFVYADPLAAEPSREIPLGQPARALAAARRAAGGADLLVGTADGVRRFRVPEPDAEPDAEPEP